MNSKNRILPVASKIIGLFLLIVSFIAGWAWMDYQSVLNESVTDEQAVIFEIKRGDSFNRITERLISQELTIEPLWFKVLAHKNKVVNKLKAGEYVIEPGTTAPELLALFSSGKTRQYSITFPEGWSFKEMLREIKSHPQLSETLNELSDLEIMAKLGVRNNHPEGLFFPDTYFFNKDTSDLSLLKRAYDKMQTVLNSEWDKREQDLPFKNSYQALILASIVEKETGQASERAIIAGVFIRRLRKGMLLQTDPTVIYGMGENYNGNIRSRDLTNPTPYNTYVIKGLTPTPIAMPGKDAIHAVLHPAKGTSLYFVSRNDGSHVFSTSLKEHNRAVDIFQRKKK